MLRSRAHRAWCRATGRRRRNAETGRRPAVAAILQLCPGRSPSPPQAKWHLRAQMQNLVRIPQCNSLFELLLPARALRRLVLCQRGGGLGIARQRLCEHAGRNRASDEALEWLDGFALVGCEIVVPDQ